MRPTCCSLCPCNPCFVMVVLLFALAAIAPTVGDMVAAIGGATRDPTLRDTVLAVVGSGAALGGLWLGFRHHGHRAPLTLGMLGLAIAVIGTLTGPFVTAAGAGTVFVAAAWSALALRAL